MNTKLSPAVAVALVVVCLCVMASVWYMIYGKKKAGGDDQPMDSGMMMPGGESGMMPDAPGGPMAAEAPITGGAEEPPPDPNAYLTSTYLGGRGERERVAKLVEEGVTVGDNMVKLEAFTREYSQAFAIPTKTALNLTAETEHARITASGARTHLQVGLQAIKREAPRRPPLNICLVVDRSGSMGDERKIEYARQAAIEVVDRLAETDTIAVIAYDDTAQVLAPAARATGKAALRQKLETLAPGGSTDIHAALQAGYAEVQKGLDSEAINQVILLSDGMVTAGISDLGAFGRLTSRMFDDDIQTTAVGMGLQYDENLMMTVARQGKGNYHFVRDPASIGEIFQEELEDLTHVVAQALRLRIKVADDVKLLRVLGSVEMEEDAIDAAKTTERRLDERVYRELGITPDRQEIEDEPGLKMLIPQFYMGDSHVVMLEIEVPPGKGKREIADVYLKYKDVVFRKNRETETAATIEYTPLQDTMVASLRQPVKKNRLGFETGEALKKAAAFIHRGQNGKAATAISEQMDVLGLAAQEWKDPDLNRDHQLMGAYVQVIGGLGSGYAADTDLGEYLAKSLTYSAYQRTH